MYSVSIWVRVATTALLVGLPVYVMAVNEPIMRPSSEEVLLCEPQSEAGIQLEHYNSYHNQREKHGWQLSASSVPTTGKCQGNDDLVNVLTVPSTIILSYYKEMALQ